MKKSLFAVCLSIISVYNGVNYSFKNQDKFLLKCHEIAAAITPYENDNIPCYDSLLIKEQQIHLKKINGYNYFFDGMDIAFLDLELHYDHN